VSRNQSSEWQKNVGQKNDRCGVLIAKIFLPCIFLPFHSLDVLDQSYEKSLTQRRKDAKDFDAGNQKEHPQISQISTDLSAAATIYENLCNLWLNIRAYPRHPRFLFSFV
jgi:hypothetical protein